jgi:chromosome segregation ATPase
MPKAALEAKNDALGILALGSLIVNLAQTKVHGNLESQHQRLLAQYRELVARYNQMWREFEGLRSVNQQLQRQGHEYQRIVDDLRGQLSKLQVRLAEKEAAK